MKRLVLPIVVAALFCVTGCSQKPMGEAVYEQAIANLAEGRDDATIERALKTLHEGGINAFPTFIRHFDDRRPAAKRYFMRDVVGPHGEQYRPTVGNACFDLMQTQIEVAYGPKAYRYEVLTPDSIAAWWEARRSRSLQQLRVEAAHETIKLAQERSASADTMRLLKRRLHAIERSQWPVE